MRRNALRSIYDYVRLRAQASPARRSRALAILAAALLAHGACTRSALDEAMLLSTQSTAPNVLAVSISQGPTGGETSISITGNGFLGATSANIGGTAQIDSFLVISDSLITGVTSKHVAANNLSINVINAAGTGTLPNAFSYLSALAYNTVADDDPFGKDWNGSGLVPSDSTVAVRWTATVEPTGIGINMARNCPANDRTGPSFHAPSVIGGFTISIGLALAPGDVAETIRLRLVNEAGATLKNLNCNLTSQNETIFSFTTTTADGWAANDDLWSLVLANEDGRQARGIITRKLKVTPSGATGILASNFLRTAVNPSTLRDSIRNVCMNYGRGPIYSPHSSMRQNTNATGALIEFWSSLRDGDPFGYTGQNAAGGVLKVSNVTPLQQLTAGTTVKLTHQLVTLDGSQQEIDIVSGLAALKSASADWLARGTQPRCSFTPTSAHTVVVPDVLTGAAIVYKDDSTGGSSATEPWIGGWPQLRRYGLQGVPRFNGRVINDTMGSWKWENELGTAGDYSRAQTFASTLALCNPTIFIDLGESNSARDGIAPIVHCTALSQAYDAVKAALPNIVIHAVSAIQRAGFEEGTMDMYREGKLEAAYAGIAEGYIYNHTDYVNFHRGDNLITYPTDFSDGVHQSNAAQPIFANAIAAFDDGGHVTPLVWHPKLIPGAYFGRTMDASSAVHVSAGLLVQLDDENNNLGVAQGFYQVFNLVPKTTGIPVNNVGWVDGTQCLVSTAGVDTVIKSSANVAAGYYTTIIIGKFAGAAPNHVLWTQKTAAETRVFSGAADSILATRPGPVVSGKNVSNGWTRTDIPTIFGDRQGGTQSSHLPIKNNTVVSTTNGSGTDNVLGTQVTSLMYWLGDETGAQVPTGLIKRFQLVNHNLLDPVLTRMYKWAQTNIAVQ